MECCAQSSVSYQAFIVDDQPSWSILQQDLEDLEDAEGLHSMFAAIRGLIMLNDTMLLETMVNEDNVMDVVGALE